MAISSLAAAVRTWPLMILVKPFKPWVLQLEEMGGHALVEADIPATKQSMLFALLQFKLLISKK